MPNIPIDNPSRSHATILTIEENKVILILEGANDIPATAKGAIANGVAMVFLSKKTYLVAANSLEVEIRKHRKAEIHGWMIGASASVYSIVPVDVALDVLERVATTYIFDQREELNITVLPGSNQYSQ